jgi:hypothetical protein
MRWFPLLLALAACRPTSLLELEVFVSSDALSRVQPPALAFVDLGPGQIGRAVSLCDWQAGEFRRAPLDDIEYRACQEPVTLRGVLAPFPEGNTCNPDTILFLDLPPEDEWVATSTLEVFSTDACSIIESQTLIIGGDEEE